MRWLLVIAVLFCQVATAQVALEQQEMVNIPAIKTATALKYETVQPSQDYSALIDEIRNAKLPQAPPAPLNPLEPFYPAIGLFLVLFLVTFIKKRDSYDKAVDTLKTEIKSINKAQLILIAVALAALFFATSENLTGDRLLSGEVGSTAYLCLLVILEFFLLKRLK